ncbi:MAG TPA: VWA domain-containing protein [Patescibacteria group bacterium]|nr:VWA domain-containing protein [Patescibacteria group bacterium]
MKKLILQLALVFFVSSLLVFFAVNFASSQNSSDAIAIRVMSNPNHYTIERWYQAQGFKGSPQSLVVDGYQAIRDGRTVYVNAANINTSTSQIYTNIYLISYTQESENATVDILGQIVSHWKFNHNIINTGKCSISTMYCQEDGDCPGNYVCGNENNDWQEGKCVIEDITSDLSNTKTCLTDEDCPNNLYCTSLKSQVIRDVRRLGQLTDVNYLLDLYNRENNKYPTLNSGTYIPQMSISTWPSWQTELSKEIQLSSNVIDPVNTLGYCGGDFALDTCWDSDTQNFFDSNLQDGIDLPDNSLVYVYTTDVNGTDYDICANMESGYDVADGGVSNMNCNFDIGYFGSINNETPVLVDYNLRGVGYETFSGMIKVEDPEGNPMTWQLDTSPSSWFSWSSAPELQNTNNPNQKEVFAQIAGDSGIYPIEIIVSDNAGNVMQKELNIEIGNIGPQIQAEDINYVIDEDNALDYTASIFSNNLPDSIANFTSNLTVSYTGFPANFNNGTFSTAETNLGHGLSKNITKVADNRFALNITGLLGDTNGDGSINENLGLDDPESEQINFNLSVQDKSGLGSNESFSFNVIFEKPQPVLQCQEVIRAGEDYSCQIINENLTNETTFSFSGLPDNITGNQSTGLISGVANEVGEHNITVTAENEYGGTNIESFNLKINNYCGDGSVQNPNTEQGGGPYGDGKEECDGIGSIALSPQDSSVYKEYDCTTKLDDYYEKPVPQGTCTFDGGYCGDNMIQEVNFEGTKLEECDFGGDIADCCVDCSWINNYEEVNLTFQNGESEVYLAEDDTVYINFPQVRAFDSTSGLMDAKLINTEAESTAVVYVTDTSGSMGWNNDVADVIDALVGTGVGGGGALGDLHNHDSEISVGLVEYNSNVSSDYIRDISIYSNYEDLVTKVEAYTAGGGTYTASALESAYNMLSNFEADNKFVVLLSDGRPSDDPSTIANTIKSSGISIYTITYSDDQSLFDDMCYWSSDDNSSVCDAHTNYVYSYQSNNASEVFDSITDEITTGPEGTLIVTINNEPYNFDITGETMNNLNVNYEGVECEPLSASCNPDKVPITVNFQGEGGIWLNNLRLGVVEQCGN